MFDWIYSNREAFLSNYVEIGRNHAAAKKLQEEHIQFTTASNVSKLEIEIKKHFSSSVNIKEL